MAGRLQQVLQEIGKAPEEIVLPDSSRALLLPHGGRVLGLYSGDSDENFFWTNPALNSVQTARVYYDRPGWPNSGGDRTWLSPERELFISDSNRAWETYKVPQSVDPGRYVLEKKDGGVCLVSRMVVEQLQARKSAEVEAVRSISPAPNPMRRISSLCRDVEYAGYTLNVSLRFTSNTPEVPIAVGLWNLLQLPNGGEMFLPTYGTAEPVVQFGQVPCSDISASPSLLRYRMSADGIQKIGLHAHAVAGRAAYLRKLSEETFELVVHNFIVNPSGEYIDSPWNDPNGEGYCFQACNVSDENLGRFSEIEHHAPAIGGESNRISCSDESQVWAFRGPGKSILQIMMNLLGPYEFGY